MEISQRERDKLHQALYELMGTDVASTQMDHLPPVGWADVATKHDLRELERRLDAKFEIQRMHIRAEISGGRSELQGEMAGLRGEFNDGIAGLRVVLHQEIGALRAEFHQALRESTRAYLLGNLGLVATVAVLAFGAAYLA